MPISSPTRSKQPSAPTSPLFRECERKRITKTDRERKTERVKACGQVWWSHFLITHCQTAKTVQKEIIQRGSFQKIEEKRCFG